jgi:hypothetical protein
MSKLQSFIQKESTTIERIYRILFYILCISLLVSAVIKIGGVLNKRIGIGELKFRMDHILHALAYFLFSMYYLSGQYFGLRLFKKGSHIFFFIIIFLVGFLAETLQIWVTYRSFSLMDLLSNLVGIISGYVVTEYILRQKAIGRGLKAEAGRL